MSERDPLLEDYTNRPVPAGKSVHWTGLALVVIAIFVSLPAYIQGIKLGHALGFYPSLLAFCLGSVMLMIIGALCAVVGARTGLSTYMITRFAFGSKGAKVVNLLFCITIFGWFGVVVAEFSQALLQSLTMLDLAFTTELSVYTFGGSLLMVATAVFGFKGLNTLSNLVTPLLMLSMLVIIVMSIQSAGWSAIAEPRVPAMGLGNAISSVVGSMIVTMIIFPDYSRYVRNSRQAVIAVIVSLCLLPVFFATAAISALATGATQLVPVIVSLGLGVMGLLVVVFAAWTTNASNLYVTTLSLATIFTGRKGWHLTLVCGLCGFLVALAGLSQYLIPFLITLGVCLPPVSAIYLIHYFQFSGGHYDEAMLSASATISPSAFLAWALASSAGYLTANDKLTVTGVASLDSVLVAAVLYYALKKSALDKKIPGIAGCNKPG